MLEHALKQLESYVSYFSHQEIPVLRRTMKELAVLREDEENVSGRKIASVVLQDPLMAMRVLTYLEAHRKKSQNHDITTVDRAIMMLGISPFFAHFSDLPVVEDKLATHPKALVGLLRVITRAKRAAHLARDWAAIRHDLDLDEVTVAALLHEAAEILFWIFAPNLMQQVVSMQHSDPSLRSSVAQQRILNVSVRDVQLGLVREWRLPELLVTLMDEQHANHPRVRNVVLAINLARHSANGWDDAALPDDYIAACDLLHVSLDTLLHRIGVPEEIWPKVHQDVHAKNPLVP